MKRTMVPSSFGSISLLLAISLLPSCSDENTTSTSGASSSSGGANGGAGGEAGGSGGTGGNAGSGGAATGGGGNGGSATGGGGMGGSMFVCMPGEKEFCYSGPSGTEIVGVCKAGLKTCLADGSGFGPCVGEVVPSPESCATMGDDDCDGMANEEGADCACVPNSPAPCYTGAMNTLNLGDCKAGTQTCNAQGTAYGPCIGEVTPQMETCLMPGDEDCDGQINEGGLSCVCVPNMPAACYTGLMGTLNIGDCKAGTATCNAQGTAYGPCMGEVTPQMESCALPGDEDCDGQINEGGLSCVCTPNTTTTCYTGPMGTQGIGECKPGMQACNAQGTMYGPCIGEVIPAAENCATAGDDDCDGIINEGCNALWAKSFGDAADQDVYDVATDAQGNVIVVGQFAGTVDFGGGPLTSPTSNGDVFVAKYDSAGNHMWSKRFGANGIDRAHGVAVDSLGNVLVTGIFQSTVDFGGGPFSSVGGTHDIFVVALDASGNHLLSRAFGSTGGDEGSAVTFDAAGNAIVVGHMTGSIDFGAGVLTSAGGDDGFVAKFSPLGLLVFANRYGDALNQSIKDVATDASGNVYFTGSFNGNIDFGGGTFVNAGATDAMVVKLSPTGTHQWSRHLAGANVQQGTGIAIDGANNVIVTGNMQSTVDFGTGPLMGAGGGDIFLAKYSSANVPLWAKIFGDNFEQSGLGVKADTQNNILLTGRMTNSADFGGGVLTSAGSTDMFLAKFDAAGMHTWSKRSGDALEQWGRAVTSDASNNVIAAGRFQGTMSFGMPTLTSAGGNDGYIVKYGP